MTLYDNITKGDIYDKIRLFPREMAENCTYPFFEHIYNLYTFPCPGTQQHYFTGNVVPGHFGENSQSAGRTYSGTPGSYTPWVSSPFFASYTVIQTANEAYKSVLSDVYSPFLTSTICGLLRKHAAAPAVWLHSG